jgi:hypothetical protein
VASAPPEELLDEEVIGVVAGELAAGVAVSLAGASFLLHAPKLAATTTVPSANAMFFSVFIA